MTSIHLNIYVCPHISMYKLSAWLSIYLEIAMCVYGSMSSCTCSCVYMHFISFDLIIVFNCKIENLIRSFTSSTKNKGIQTSRTTTTRFCQCQCHHQQPLERPVSQPSGRTHTHVRSMAHKNAADAVVKYVDIAGKVCRHVWVYVEPALSSRTFGIVNSRKISHFDASQRIVVRNPRKTPFSSQQPPFNGASYTKRKVERKNKWYNRKIVHQQDHEHAHRYGDNNKHVMRILNGQKQQRKRWVVKKYF